MSPEEQPPVIPNVPTWMGLLCMIAGFLAIGAPFVAGATATLIVASLLCLSGVGEIIGAVKSDKKGILTLISGVLSLVGGALIFSRPLMGMGILTLMIGIYFWMDGFGKIMLSLKLKPQSGWGVILFGGMVTLLLGILILSKWPLSGVWAIGTLVGINMVTSGMTIVMLSQGLKVLGQQVEAMEANLAEQAKPAERIESD